MDHLHPLIEFAVILILAVHSKGETWGLKVNRSITAVTGKSLTIPCTFSYPPEHHTENPELYWKLPQKSAFNTYDRDGNAFIFHPNVSFVVKRYQGKTSMMRGRNNRSCTLKIDKLMDSKLVVYLRLIAKNNNFSFYQQKVTISPPGLNAVLATFNPGMIFPTPSIPSLPQHIMNRNLLQTIYIAIFVPLAAVVILAAGFVMWKKRAKSQLFLRQGSGYYANFSRASPQQATSKENCNKQNNKKLPDRKVMEEPIYMNMQLAAGQTDTREGDQDIYENVDYTI
ncbi:sialoadhesin-like [Vanacampus margaritifer]